MSKEVPFHGASFDTSPIPVAQLSLELHMFLWRVLASGHMLEQLIVTNNFSLKILEKNRRRMNLKVIEGSAVDILMI